LASLGEIIGYRRVSQIGLIVFTLASLACAFSNTLLELTAARVLQGIGAAGILSVNSALVRLIYPQRLLGHAMGINAVVVAIAAALGPTFASAILALSNWRWLFAINVPIGALAIVVAAISLPASHRTQRPLNLAGAALSASTLAFFVTGLQALAHDGTGQAIGFAGITLSIAGAFALVRRELHAPHPLVPFDLLRIRLFGLSVATSIASFMGQMLGLVALPFELQRIGYSAVETGLLITPWPLAAGISAPLAGRLSDRYPAGILGAIGLGLFSCGLIALALLPEGHGVVDVVWRMALCGFGFGFFQTPNNRAMMSSAPRARVGSAGGMLGTARVLGQSIGAAIAAMLFRLQPGIGAKSALALAAAIAIGGGVVSLARLRGDGAKPSGFTRVGMSEPASADSADNKMSSAPPA
jgi:MFS transporter, DHA2 family, multidrug resistance protein